MTANDYANLLETSIAECCDGSEALSGRERLEVFQRGYTALVQACGLKFPSEPVTLKTLRVEWPVDVGSLNLPGCAVTLLPEVPQE